MHAFRPLTYSAEIGARCPCCLCAPGKAILAFLPEVEREATVSRLKLKRFTSVTITARQMLESELVGKWQAWADRVSVQPWPLKRPVK